MEKVFANKKDCSGCGVCAEHCPKNAITLKADGFGFLYPEIDQKLCVDCGICRNVCHMLNKNAAEKMAQRVVALKSKDPQVIKTSQSGGAFAELAKCVLEESGVVYGAAFGAQFNVSHIRIDNMQELHRLQGSKYVQSELTGIFREVKQDLEAQTQVLFSGTPCQVAALNAYLNKSYDNLFAVDVVCHGVMAPQIWKDYIAYTRKKYGEFTQANFRDKAVGGWRGNSQSFRIKGEIKGFRTYGKLFNSNCFLRESCYTPEKSRIICKYGGLMRCSDLTIGDFWGIENVNSNIPDDNTGISVCLINSEKGEKLFAKIADSVIWEEHTLEDINIKGKNPHFGEGDPYLSKKLKKARAGYLKKGFSYIAGKYADLGFRGFCSKGMRFLKRCIRKNV